MPEQGGGVRFEDKIREFLNKIGFEDVPDWGENRKLLFLGDQEIDAFGHFGNLYIVVDSRITSSLKRRGKDIQSQLTKINGYRDQVIQDIKTKYESAHGYRDCLFIFWTEEKKILPSHRSHAEKFKIALRDSYDLTYYQEAFNILDNKDIVRNSFLKDISQQLGIDIFIEDATVNCNAIMTRIGNKEFYTFLIQAKQLLKFSYVFRVETNNILGSYQRLLDMRKLEKIRKYLLNGGFFANNILVASDTEPDFNNKDHKQAKITGTLTLPDKPCYLEIIDGQHRLFAYSKLPSLMEQCLCVTVIWKLDEKERARLFVVINREQTKVPPDLLWDLYQTIEPDRLRGEISKFVQRMNENHPLHNQIKLPRVRSQLAYLSFTNLCLALYTRTNLYKNYGSKNSFYHVVKGFLEVIQSDGSLKEDWDRCVVNMGSIGFVCTNNALSVYMYLLSMILKKREENGTKFPISRRTNTWKVFLRREIIPHIVEYLQSKSDQENQDDPYGSLREKLTNEGARREAAKEIFKQVKM
jgi:DGQHR domain-containing protein